VCSGHWVDPSSTFDGFDENDDNEKDDDRNDDDDEGHKSGGNEGGNVSSLGFDIIIE
jgi:hypothetical protein